MPTILDTIFAMGAVGLGGLALFWAMRPHWALVVVADKGGVRQCRGIPKLHQAKLAEFLTKEISFQGRLTIRGHRQKNGLIRLQVNGSVDSGSRQRIRNFVLS